MIYMHTHTDIYTHTLTHSQWIFKMVYDYYILLDDHKMLKCNTIFMMDLHI